MRVAEVRRWPLRCALRALTCRRSLSLNSRNVRLLGALLNRARCMSSEVKRPARRTTIRPPSTSHSNNEPGPTPSQRRTVAGTETRPCAESLQRANTMLAYYQSHEILTIVLGRQLAARARNFLVREPAPAHRQEEFTPRGTVSTPHPPRRLAAMEIRLTRRPGQAGTMKYVKRYAERLVCVRYRYDPENGCRHKTVELIVETVPWESRARRSRRRDEETVAVRIGYQESDLRERAKRLGAIWRPQQKLWELRWLDAKRLGIGDRVAPP